MPVQKTGYTLNNINKYTLWVDPKWSQYKAKQVDMSSYTPGDTFTISDAAMKTGKTTYTTKSLMIRILRSLAGYMPAA